MFHSLLGAHSARHLLASDPAPRRAGRHTHTHHAHAQGPVRIAASRSRLPEYLQQSPLAASLGLAASAASAAQPSSSSHGQSQSQSHGHHATQRLPLFVSLPLSPPSPPRPSLASWQPPSASSPPASASASSLQIPSLFEFDTDPATRLRPPPSLHPATTTTATTTTTAAAAAGPSGSPAKRAKTPAPARGSLPAYALPTSWNSSDKSKLVDLSHNNLRVIYQGTGKSDLDAAAVRANTHIVSKGRDGYIGIGFCGSKVPLGRLPGWEDMSWGYHGDDGFSFNGSGTGKPYGPVFTTGDTIGCCLNFMNMSASFTKNGIMLGVAFKDLLANRRHGTRLYPSVGLRTPGEVVEANFGQRPFKFDITQYYQDERSRFMAAINASPLTYRSALRLLQATMINHIVMSYLINSGYSETAASFYQSAFGGSPSAVSDAAKAETHGSARLVPALALDGNVRPFHQYPGAKSIRDRQYIQRLIVTGDIDTAIAEITRRYSGLLSSNKTVRFQLDCLKFISLIVETSGTDMPDPASTGTGTGTRHTGDVQTDDEDQFYDAMDTEDEFAFQANGGGSGHQRQPSHGRAGSSKREQVPGSVFAKTEEDAAMSAGGLAGAAGSDAGGARGSPLDVILFGQRLQELYGGDPDESIRAALQETFALVCYARPETSPLAYLITPASRHAIAKHINQAILLNEKCQQTAPLDTLVRQALAVREMLVDEDVGAASFIDPQRDCLPAS
ncbi:hypothetical protein BC831DRAFT_445150 [Entophlyctis helioformis]|nr:hypothetical protein BC831DRAFT_445150 [Entophlyctis helioformis]